MLGRRQEGEARDRAQHLRRSSKRRRRWGSRASSSPAPVEHGRSRRRSEMTCSLRPNFSSGLAGSRGPPQGGEGVRGAQVATSRRQGDGGTGLQRPPVRHRPPRATLRGRAVPLKPGNQDPLHVVPRGPELGGDRHREAQCHWSAGSGRPPASPRSLQRCHQAQASTWLRLRLLPRGWKRQAGLAQPPTLAPRESSGSGTAEKKTCCKLLTSARKTIKSLEQNPLSKLIF